MTRWANHYLQYRLYVSILHYMRHQYHKLINPSSLIYPSIDWLILKRLYHSEVYVVHSTIIPPGYWVSDFVGNLRTQKTNKSQTKQANSIYAGFGTAYARVTSSGVKFMISFILYLLHFLTICANFTFCLRFCHRHQKSAPPPTESIRTHIVTVTFMNSSYSSSSYVVVVPPPTPLTPPLSW